MHQSQHRGSRHNASGQRVGCPSFWGLLCSFDQLSSLHTTTNACSSSQWPCPPYATMILHLHICTSISGGPAWLLPHLPGGTHEGGWTSAGQAAVTRRGSAPCLSLGFTEKGLGSGPVNCSSCSCRSAAHCEVPDTPARRRSPPNMCLCTPANSQTGSWAAGSSSTSTSPSGEELGLSARGFPNWLIPGQQDAAVPLCQSFGSGRTADLCFHSRDLCQSEKPHVHTLEWWQAQLSLAPAQSRDTSSHDHRLLFLPVPLPARAN